MTTSPLFHNKTDSVEIQKKHYTSSERFADSELERLLDLATFAAISGGSILQELYGKPHDIHKKGAVNLVTEADLAAETAILSLLKEQTPEFQIMSEEKSTSHTLCQSETIWIVDPLDGTTNFAHGFPFFAVSIGLLQHGQPQVGVVYAPLLNELYTAKAGAGAFLNGVPIQTSTACHLVESLVATGFPYERKGVLDGITQRLHRVLEKVQDVRRAGSAALDLAMVACGHLDAYYEQQLNPWDSAAGWLLVLEAGGQVTDFSGAPYSPFTPHILATNGLIHDEMRALL